jgi:diadenosine tetraphosphatase ApaH/serine/threonine PP2A family protein phosphatase
LEPVTVAVDGVGAVLCCHASARNDDRDVFTVRSRGARVRAFLADVTERVVTCGHTHMQFDRDVDGLRIVNVGSVGCRTATPARAGPRSDMA